MTFFKLIFVAISGNFDGFVNCILCGIYVRFAKKMADPSQLIFSLAF